MRASLGNIEEGTNGGHEYAQALNIFLRRVVRIVQEFLDTLVHNAFCQHLELEEFANELGETGTSSPSLLRGIVLVRSKDLVLGISLWKSGRWRSV